MYIIFKGTKSQKVGLEEGERQREAARLAGSEACITVSHKMSRLLMPPAVWCR